MTNMPGGCRFNDDWNRPRGDGAPLLAIGDHLLNRYNDEQRKQARDIIDCFWKIHHVRENPEWLRKQNLAIH